MMVRPPPSAIDQYAPHFVSSIHPRTHVPSAASGFLWYRYVSHIWFFHSHVHPSSAHDRVWSPPTSVSPTSLHLPSCSRRSPLPLPLSPRSFKTIRSSTFTGEAPDHLPLPHYCVNALDTGNHQLLLGAAVARPLMATQHLLGCSPCLCGADGLYVLLLGTRGKHTSSVCHQRRATWTEGGASCWSGVEYYVQDGLQLDL